MLFDLKETTTPFQLEAAIILQSPCSTYWLLQIALALPDLISYRMRTDSEVARMGTCTHTHKHHTSLSQHSSPVAFIALDWRMKLVNQ